MPDSTRFGLERLDTRVGPIALVTIANGSQGRRPNTLGEPALASLDVTLNRLGSRAWRGLVLTGSDASFVAGADIDEFVGMTAEQAREGAVVGHELFRRLRDLPFLTLAAINGSALGGGVEIALHCDYRSIASSVRHFACPEVFLGIVPGWGGSQLIPQLVGAEEAVRFIVENPLRQNRMLTAAQAFEAGFVDAVFEPATFADESLEYLLDRIEEGPGKRMPAAGLADVHDVCRGARARLDGQIHGATPAPYRALDLIEGAATWTLDEGYRAEQDATAELLPSPQAQASLYSFFLVERRSKRGVGRPDAPARPVTKVGVAGAGMMGRQFALLALRRLEVPVVLRDVTREQVDAAIAWVEAELTELVTRGRLLGDEASSLRSRVSGGTDSSLFEDCDLVLEAVVEELEVKKEVLAELEPVVSRDCVLATNTSALSVTEIAAGLTRPERVVGMHFFNPVAMLPLVELVRTPQTDDVTIATAWDAAQRLRKKPVVVKDAPGFVVNRLLTRVTTVLLDALERGNTVEETDDAVLRLGVPMAPSVLLELVGPGLANRVLHALHDSFPDRFPLSDTLDNLAAGREEIVVRERAPRRVDEIHEAVLEALAAEIRKLLDEGVVAEAADVDTCLLLGAGYPFWLGGITKHLDQRGVSERVTGRLFSPEIPPVPA